MFILKEIKNNIIYKSNQDNQILIMGKSNVGKSSILNTITNEYKIARKSKFPGQTKSINLFWIKKYTTMADLPGYAYNNLKKKSNISMETTLIKYLALKKNIIGIILLIDIKRYITGVDYNIIKLGLSYQVPLHILFSKSDKIKFAKIKEKYYYNIANITGYEYLISTQLFSLYNKYTIQNLILKINKWIN